MSLKKYILCVFICMASVGLNAEDAPVTKAGFITNATTVPGSVIVPVTVKNFVSIGYIKLTLRYKADRVNFVSAMPHPSFPGMTVNNIVTGTVGKLVITWPQTPGGITLPDETHLLDLTFTYLSSTSSLVWITSNDTNCYYKRYSNGSYITLNDSPGTSFYFNGGISNRGAPQTFAPVIIDPLPGEIQVPLTVNNFNSIGSVNLNLEYDQSVLTFMDCIMNPGLGGTTNIGTVMGPDGKMLIIISWYGLATLPEGSTLATITFNYSNINGNWSGINFFETGSSCEFADQYANALIDIPTGSYYHNGLIYTQYAPRTWLPEKTDATPYGAIELPVYVNDFNEVRSFNLTFEYEGNVMTYTGFTPGSAFGDALSAIDSPSGSKRKVTMNWTGTADMTLPQGSLIGTINFTYITGTTSLTWIVSDATSCRFNDSNGNAYCDSPKSVYYQDGMVVSHVAPLTVGGQQSAVSGQNVVVPVKIYNYTNIGEFALTLDYDPSVLTYQGAALVPAIGGTFSASTAGQGRIMMDWSGPAASLSNNSTLVNLTFTYNGGETTLAWYDIGNSCHYAETPSGTALYDLPKSDFYINGYTGPSPLTANFTANNTSGDLNATITLTDQSTGSPTGWNWSLSPSTYYFVNGTSASSQNPQVKFTSNGGYTVTLIVTKGTTGAAEIKTDYLHIGTAGLWTGITSTDWNTVSNWHNYAIPTSAVNVVIPSSAANWPEISGDLNIGGIHCLNLTVQGSGQLTVNGNLSVSGTSILTFTGPGSLFLSGNWTNNGTFTCGTSTVTFTGTANSSVNDNGTAQDFYQIVVTKSPGKVTFLGDVNVLGEE